MPAPKFKHLSLPHAAGPCLATALGLGLALAMGLAGCGGGGSAGPTAVERQEGVTAVEVLDRMTAAYRDATSYFDNAEYRESFFRQGDDQLVEPPSHQVSVALERPNRFRITRRVPETDSPPLEVAVACDGERLRATVSDAPGQLLDHPAPDAATREAIALDDYLRSALLPVPIEGLFPQLDLLLATPDAPAALLADAEAELLTGKAIDAVGCYRVKLRRPVGDYVLWIAKGDHLLRRVEVPTQRLREQLDPSGAMLQWRLWIELLDVTTGGVMDDSVFDLPTPDGAETVDKLSAPKPPPS